MEEVADSSDVLKSWRAQWPEAERNPRIAARIAREANGRGEHMLAFAMAQRALRGLSLVAEPGEATPLRQQMALALARSGSIEEAMEVLQDAVVAGPEAAETLGLMGRLHKDLAWRMENAAHGDYHRQKALECYNKGFALERNSYCGINAAVLSALTGDLCRARKIARELLEIPPEADRLWAVATIAMVRLICGEKERAREAFELADRAGRGRRSDLAAVRREARRLASVLDGEPMSYESCFSPAAVAVFEGRGERLEERDHARLARWLQDNCVVCAWAAAASGEEAEFLERAVAFGVETFAVLPGSVPRAAVRKALQRASGVESVAGTSLGTISLARRLATARAVAQAASWDVPLLAVSTGRPPRCWRDLAIDPLVLRPDADPGERPESSERQIRAVLCVCPVEGVEDRPRGASDLRSLWESHAARCGTGKESDGPYFFGWPSLGSAARAAVELHRNLQVGKSKACCGFVLHVTDGETGDTQLADWTRRVYPGRVHATGRFADLAAIESRPGFELCLVGTLDCRAAPLGIRLYHLRMHGEGGGFAGRDESEIRIPAAKPSRYG